MDNDNNEFIKQKGFVYFPVYFVFGQDIDPVYPADRYVDISRNAGA